MSRQQRQAAPARTRCARRKAGAKSDRAQDRQFPAGTYDWELHWAGRETVAHTTAARARPRPRSRAEQRPAEPPQYAAFSCVLLAERIVQAIVEYIGSAIGQQRY